jgi:hypothetical protein
MRIVPGQTFTVTHILCICLLQTSLIFKYRPKLCAVLGVKNIVYQDTFTLPTCGTHLQYLFSFCATLYIEWRYNLLIYPCVMCDRWDLHWCLEYGCKYVLYLTLAVSECKVHSMCRHPNWKILPRNLAPVSNISWVATIQNSKFLILKLIYANLQTSSCPLKTEVLWDVMLCGLVNSYRRFGGS